MCFLQKEKNKRIILFLSYFTLSLHAKIRKMIETFLISMLIIAIAVILLCVKIILRKNGKFSSQHISDNAALKKQNIHCVLKQDVEERLARSKRSIK